MNPFRIALSMIPQGLLERHAVTNKLSVEHANSTTHTHTHTMDRKAGTWTLTHKSTQSREEVLSVCLTAIYILLKDRLLLNR